MTTLTSIKKDTEKLMLAKKLIDEIQGNASTVVNRIDSGIDINNLDEVKAALHNELNKAVKPLITGIKELSKQIKSQEQVLNDKNVNVKNLGDISNDVTVKNIDEFGKSLSSIIDAINNIEIQVAQPEVQVSVPEIKVPNIPAPVVNIPETKVETNVDLSAIIKSLDSNLNKIKTNNKNRPLAVRMTDGQEWIKQIDRVVEEQRVAFQGFSDNFRIKNSKNGIIDPATEGGQDKGLLVPETFDQIDLTYVAAGNGEGEVETATYKEGGATVATLTITYNSDDEISSVART